MKDPECASILLQLSFDSEEEMKDFLRHVKKFRPHKGSSFSIHSNYYLGTITEILNPMDEAELASKMRALEVASPPDEVEDPINPICELEIE